jgi:DNA modification methylase
VNLGTAQVIRADARHLPLGDDTVDLIVTSPPYFGLRSYTDGGEHYEGQVGAEASPQEFLDALLEVTAECARVLKPTGSMWVNLGDKYVADNRGSGGDKKRGEAKHAPRGPAGFVGEGIMPKKSLMGLPWRYANRVVDELGLILRQEVIWSKPNGLPESVTDRVKRSHEQWFHFTLEPRYFSAVDEIREPYHPGTAKRYEGGYSHSKTGAARQSVNADYSGTIYAENPLGKLPGSVWTIATEPLKIPDHVSHALCCDGKKRDRCEDGIDHFAAFPTEWPKRIIQGWAPTGICTACGDARRQGARPGARPAEIAARGAAHSVMSGGTAKSTLNGVTTRIITGYACACETASAETTPAVVLDPFGGTGTTAMVAKALGRTGISVDLSADYCRLAEWRTNDRDQLAKVLGIPKAEHVPESQDDLLSLIGDGS